MLETRMHVHSQDRLRAAQRAGLIVLDRLVGRLQHASRRPFLRLLTLSPAAYGRLLKKTLEPDDYMLLAHLFEEISVLALHHLIPEALLFDAFAFDLYWDELREDVMALRAQTGNDKFCENFEIAAERARAYRTDRPPKLRWIRRGGEDAPPDPPGGLGVRPPGPRPHGAPARPRSEPVGHKDS